MSMDFLTFNVATGQLEQRIPTAEELAVREAVRTQDAANIAVEAIDEQRRTQRRQLWNSIQDIANPTWAQVETALTQARDAINRPTAQWTNVLIIDACKLALRIGVFLVARELRRIYQAREPD